MYTVSNVLPDKEFFYSTKLQAFADNRLNGFQKMFTTFGRVENIVGKGEVLVTSIFSVSPQYFHKPSILGLLKLDCLIKGYHNHKFSD